jgi:uncharacterized membrane protein
MLNTYWGRILFCASLAALNVQHLINDHLSPGIPSESLVNNSFLLLAFLYKTSVLTMTVAIIVNHRTKQAAHALGLLIVAWTSLRHVPLVIENFENPSELNSLCMALAAAGGAFMIAASIPRFPMHHRKVRLLGALDHRLARLLFGIPLIVFGFQHVRYAEFINSLVPSWIPGRFLLTLLTGIAFIAAGVSIVMAWKNKLGSAWLVGMILLCIIFVHLPRIYSNPFNDYEWTFLFQAGIVAGGALVIYQHLSVRPAIVMEELARQKKNFKSTTKTKKYPSPRGRIMTER